MNASRFNSKYLFSLILSFLVIWLSGCGKLEKDYDFEQFYASLTDTVLSEDRRQVFLSDRLGGYYFDSAANGKERSEYGFCRKQHRILAGWAVAGANGELLNDDFFAAYVTPSDISRNFQSGLEETVYLPGDRSGMILQFRSDNSDGVIFQPKIDIRNLQFEEPGSYVYKWIPEKRVLTFARISGEGGWFAFAAPKKVSWRELNQYRRENYSLSQITGRPSQAKIFLPGEFFLESDDLHYYALAHGNSRNQAIENAVYLWENFKELQNERIQSDIRYLKKLVIFSQHHRFDKSFSWARLMLRNLTYTAENEQQLFTGIPHQPYTHGFHALYSIPGIVKSCISDSISKGLVRTIINKQQSNELSTAWGMLPGAITEDSIEFRTHAISGLLPRALEYLSEESNEKNVYLSDEAAKALAVDLMGTCKYRLHYGVLYDDGKSNLFYDNPAAHSRKGVTVETESLFLMQRKFLDDFDDLYNFVPHLPSSLVKGVGRGDCARKWQQHIVASNRGNFLAPTILRCGLIPFTLMDSLGNFNLADRYTLPDTSEKEYILHHQKHRSKSFPKIFAYHYYRGRQELDAPEIVDLAQREELIGLVGFRSLSPRDTNYTATHEYFTHPQAPQGSMYNGDVILWSNGLLCDLLFDDKQYLKFASVINLLSQRVMSQGVIGGLPEGENAEPIDFARDMTGSSVYAGSLAEFIRTVSENIIGVDHKDGNYMIIRPNIPVNFEETTFYIGKGDGYVTIKRDADGNYLIRQIDLEPWLSVTLDVRTLSGEHVMGTTRLYPDEGVKMEIVQSEGRWKMVNRKLD